MIYSVRNHPLIARLLARLQASPLGYRLVSGAFWSLIAVALPKAISLVGFVLVARTLGKEGFGALGVIQNTVGMLGTFAGFGFGITATKYVSHYRYSDPGKAGRIVALSLMVSGVVAAIISLLLIVGAPYVASTWLASEALTVPLRMSTILLVLYAVNGVQMGALAGMEAFRESAVVSAWVSVFSLVAILGALWGVEGATCSLVITAGVSCVVSGRALRRIAASQGIAIELKGAWAERNTLIGYSLPAVLANALYTPAFWFCTMLLVNTRDGYTQMGEFNAANQWRSVAMLIPSVLGQAAIPIVSDCCANGRRSEAVAMLWSLFKGLALIGVPISFLLFLASGPIMSSYGSGYSGGWMTFCLLQAAVLLQVLQSPVIKYIEATGRLWLNLTFNLGQAIAMIGSSCILVNKGAKGLALALLLSFVVHSVWLFIYAIRVSISIRQKAECVSLTTDLSTL